ncbi:MAG TPA: SH3 domain-containing protein, partial [Gemmatimonadaceae bacterium]
MRSVRCDACGAKAMTAAAKCPKCSHLLDLRDGFGELLPLAYCSSCDSYSPEQLGECKWCHTKPERPPIDARIWRGIGAGLAAVVGGVWLIGNLTSSDTKRPRAKTTASSVGRKQTADSSADTTNAVAPTTVVGGVDSTPPSNSGARVAESPAAPSVPVNLPQAVPIAADPVNEPAIVQPQMAIPRAVQSNGNVARASHRAPSHWVRSVSRDWVIIRRDASKSSKVVASIGPNSRVELGESRGTWRRLRTKGVAGWVEPRNLFDV